MAKTNIVVAKPEAVDAVARLEAAAARAEAASALAAIAGDGEQVQWFVDAVPAAGVAKAGNSHLGSVRSLAPTAAPLSHQYATNVRHDPSRFTLTANGAAIGDAEAVDVDVAVTSNHNTYGLLVTNFVDCPALNAGEFLWVEFPVSWLERTGNQEIAFEVFSQNPIHATGGARLCSVLITAEGGYRAPIWSMGAGELGAVLEPPTGDDIEIVDVDGGQLVRLRYVVAAGGSIAAGELAFAVRQHGEYDLPFRVAPGRIYANIHPTAAAGYYTVSDPSVGNHWAEVPAVLEVTAAKPATAGTVLEMIGDNLAASGQFVARLAIASGGVPQLQVSENDGSTTATLPAAAWGSVPSRVCLRVSTDEAVVFIDGYAATGLPLGSAPTTIRGYTVGASSDGTGQCGLMPASIADSGAVRGLVADIYRVMLATERTNLPRELPGRIYAEHG